jgi:hypothetical protein
MSTRSAIAIQENKDGPIKYAYCHYDGYISHNGKILNEHYRDPAKVKELLSEGDLSSLGETIDKSVFFHRDRKEDLHINLPMSLKEFAVEDIFDFRYLIKQDEDGSWNWYLVDYLYGEVKLTSLTSILANHA